MVKPIKLLCEAIDRESYLPWNAFIDIIALSNYDDLSEIQRIAHLAFWYESEIQNGGHLQYFENHGTSRLQETIEALQAIGADEQADVLLQAGEQYLSRPRSRILTVESFVDNAREGEFNRFDNLFHDALQPLQFHLERYLHDNIEEFVEIK